jgi:hypothetical protein
MPIKQIDFGSKEYHQMIKLRNDILRKPLHLVFEKEFNISIPDEQAETITTVGQAVAYLEEHAK